MKPNNQEVIIRFDKVSFKYNDKKVTLDNTDFTIRKNSKITIMGQNGAGKSTIFKLLMGELTPTEGKIHLDKGLKVAIAQQMIPKVLLDQSVKSYLESAFSEKVYGIEKDIKDVLAQVNLNVDSEKIVATLSGGQKARLLLAYALIQKPDILLLDEPTNNLDAQGIYELTTFLMEYPKTVVVISHDANFLNAFTDGVLNLDVHTHKVEQFLGNYYDVLEQIAAQIERERLLNSRLEKNIQDRFEKINKLGGKSVAMRRLANKVREDIEEDKDKIVDVRKEDKTIPEFEIEAQHVMGSAVKINQVSFLKEGEVVTKDVDVQLHRGDRLIISGPNGIGKSTLLKSMLNGVGCEFNPEMRIGYYSQDFSELDYNQTAYDSLASVTTEPSPAVIFGAAGRFLLSGDLLTNKIESLSEGQKGLLCYARFMLQKPGLLIMDEPTNHINFRHLPIIAKALNSYKGVIIMVSHAYEFLAEVQTNKELDLERLK